MKKSSSDLSTIKFLRRFSSIKVDFEKEKRKTLSRYQEHGLRVSITTPNFHHDKKEIQKRLRASVERYSMKELYVKMICALFPAMKTREMPDSNALIKHLKHIFRLSDQEHSQLMEVARSTKLPQRIVNLEIVEAKQIPAKDANGLSDPFCVVFLNSRDIAQRTKVVPNTLNPVWKQYFTFRVGDVNRDILYLEVMDHNKEEEPLRDKIKKFKEIKSPSTFGVLLREIANTRSVQELIGSLRIPVSEISSETLERWFKLKNQEDKGEIYLRMALGYNKSKEAATEEFLQILHFLLVFELDREASLSAPFYWDEHYEMWSKYILRQFKWQGGLKPKDIVLAKWRAYALVNSIFPINANMICLLMDSVLERALNGEYDSREISRFWESTILLVQTIMKFLAEVHDVLPCPVTVLHTYHMLKTLELLNQFLCQPPSTSIERGKPPFTKSFIIDSITQALRNGADKFYVKVFSDSTHESSLNQDQALLVALERLLKMGQILHEDLRLGLTTIHTDFKGILSIDYLEITYKVYDEQFGKMVKFIIEEYNEKLLENPDGDQDSDETLDENSISVKTGLSVFKLYLAVKNLTELAPKNYVTEETSEYSLKKGYHEWFFHSVATWIDMLRKRIMQWVKNSISVSENSKGDSLTSEPSTNALSKTENQVTREIPISSSAVDTAQMFLEIHKFWMSLGWEDAQQSYVIVRKILEELYGFLIYYGAELLRTLKKSREISEASLDADTIHAYLSKACTSINNINYVKEQVEAIGNQLNIMGIIKRITTNKRESGEDYEGNIDLLKNKMEAQVQEVIENITESCVRVVAPKYRQLLKELPLEGVKVPIINNRQSRAVIDFIDNCLIILNVNLERGNFEQVLLSLWISSVDGIDSFVMAGQESGKPYEYFKVYHDQLLQIHSLFWPREVELTVKMENPSVFETFVGLKSKLNYLGLSLEDLKLSYFKGRYERQKLASVKNNEHGLITIRAGIVEAPATLTLEILNARNLKGYDSNNLSDPYAVVTVLPKEVYPTLPTFTTKTHKETLFPLFEETFTMSIPSDDLKKPGFLSITLYDYDFLGKDDLMGDVLLPLTEMKRLDSTDELKSQSQIHLPICKPTLNDDEMLKKFEERTWDKEAIRFARCEREKIE